MCCAVFILLIIWGLRSTIPASWTQKKCSIFKRKCTRRSPDYLPHKQHQRSGFEIEQSCTSDFLGFHDNSCIHYGNKKRRLQLVLSFERRLHWQQRLTDLKLNSRSSICTWTDAFCYVSTTKPYLSHAEHLGFQNYIYWVKRLSDNLREMFGWILSHFREHSVHPVFRVLLQHLQNKGMTKIRVWISKKECWRLHITWGHQLGHTAPGSCCFLGAQ